MDDDRPLALTPAQRKALKAQAHHLKPVVMIGEAGLTPAVLAEIDVALRAHQLVKIRVLGDDRSLRTQMMEPICASLGSAPVQSIGKLLIVYRPAADDDSNGAGASGAGKRRGPHRPKKVLGAKVESPPKPRNAARQAPSAKPSGPRGGASGGIKMTSASRKTLSEKTAGKRTDLASNTKPPVRRGAASRTTQGPVHLQGTTGPRTAGRRNRAKSGS